MPLQKKRKQAHVGLSRNAENRILSFVTDVKLLLMRKLAEMLDNDVLETSLFALACVH